MAVGNQPNMGALNATLSSCAVGLRDACAEIGKLWSYVASLGANQTAQVAGLQAIGFTAADAQAFWTQANYLYAVSQLYYGQITQASVFNFDNALAGPRGAS